mmetsp:Transcript_94856/g.306222  ORF Transcript_94856/g.306222 Transcript_94856/m.306222 type:complete len:257 (+) Transcript_94856:89-859(+)
MRRVPNSYPCLEGHVPTMTRHICVPSCGGDGPQQQACPTCECLAQRGPASRRNACGPSACQVFCHWARTRLQRLLEPSAWSGPPGLLARRRPAGAGPTPTGVPCGLPVQAHASLATSSFSMKRSYSDGLKACSKGCSSSSCSRTSSADLGAVASGSSVISGSRCTPRRRGERSTSEAVRRRSASLQSKPAQSSRSLEEYDAGNGLVRPSRIRIATAKALLPWNGRASVHIWYSTTPRAQQSPAAECAPPSQTSGGK